MKKYVEVLHETLDQILNKYKDVVLIGNGTTSPWFVASSTVGLLDKYGDSRVIDTPVSENGITGVSLGMVLNGLHPIMMFPRMDFMYYALDQIANHVVNWNYMFGKQSKLPLTIWAIVNRGGSQAAQHSQNIQAILAHLPNLKIVSPSNPYDAKGLFISCISEESPTVFLDERWLYETMGEVPDEMYLVDIGKAKVIKRGDDITVVASSYMVKEAIEASDKLAKKGISIEVIDLRTVKPLDIDLILDSVKYTGKLLVIDNGWRAGGLGAEIVAQVAEKFKCLVARVALPDTPAPANIKMEEQYYKNKNDIINACQVLCSKS